MILFHNAQLLVMLPDGQMHSIPITTGLGRVLCALSDLWATDGHRVRVQVHPDGDIRLALPGGSQCSPLGWLALQGAQLLQDDDPTALAQILGLDVTEAYALLCAGWGALDDPRRGRTILLLLALRQELMRIFGLKEDQV